MGFVVLNLSLKKGFLSPNPKTLWREIQNGVSPPKKNPPDTDSRVVEDENVKFKVPRARVLFGRFVTLHWKYTAPLFTEE